MKEVSVVSPLIEEAVVQFTLENPNYLLDVVDTIKGLSAGRPGNLVGKYWEKLIFSNLKECVKNEYSFKEEACGSTADRSYLNLCGHQSKTDTRKSIEQICFFPLLLRFVLIRFLYLLLFCLPFFLVTNVSTD